LSVSACGNARRHVLDSKLILRQMTVSGDGHVLTIPRR
jgi:hypothetical protein